MSYSSMDDDSASGWETSSSCQDDAPHAGCAELGPRLFGRFRRTTLTSTSLALNLNPPHNPTSFIRRDERLCSDSSQPSSSLRAAQASPVELSSDPGSFSIASVRDSSAPSLVDRKWLEHDPSHSIYLFAPPSATSPVAIMDSVDIPELVERLSSDEDSVRKMAVFKLQSNIGDPSFADIFIAEGGLDKLKQLILRTNGNTLAYSLASFARLLEVDMGWGSVEQDLVERVDSLDMFFRADAESKHRSSNLSSHIPSSTYYEGQWPSLFQLFPILITPIAPPGPIRLVFEH